MPSFVHSAIATATLLLATSVAAQTTPAPTASAAAPSITAVTGCHGHSTVNWCMFGDDEFPVVGPTKTEEFEAEYTGCHAHGSDTYCYDSQGEEVMLQLDTLEDEPAGHADEAAEEGGSGGHCHEHNGIEHCVGGAEASCDAPNRDYNIPLRVGLLFVILVTSGFGVFLPILTKRFNLVGDDNIIFVMLKQFGTGIVISTAFIHLLTHAQLMFASECLGVLQYEGTASAIFMAGLFLSFVVDYLGARFVKWRQSKLAGSNTETPVGGEDNKSGSTLAATPDNDSNHGHAGHSHGAMRATTPMEEKINVMNLEAGIIFHSILIGITLVVASDSFFITLFIVIIFHQMFEGIALGTCIAELPKAAASTLQKCLMAATFMLITPLGMAIGIGVLNQFNGADPTTIWVIGTLDALSAGILAWVGIVELLARDWMSGKLMHAGLLRTALAMLALIGGLILMSVLGKWA